MKSVTTLPVLYQAMLEITNRMLEAANQNHWEEIFILQQDYEECEKYLVSPTDFVCQETTEVLEVTAEEWKSVNDMIKKLLVQQTRLRRALSHRQDELIQLMRNTTNGVKQIDNYLEVAFLR